MSLKILYGIQATGNGHISRARALVPHFKAAGADVTCLFSGRDPDKLFDMALFEPYEVKKGLTFSTRNGRIVYTETAAHSHPRTLLRDIRALDLRPYDVIITDFEPVTAWAAKHAKRDCLGIANMCAYEHDIPVDKETPAAKMLMKKFAPVSTGLGQHWHHFDSPILPPIIDAPETSSQADPRKIVVYMGFENPEKIAALVSSFEDYRFHVYSPEVKESYETGNAVFNPPSRDGFHHDLADCAGVICNAGFELPSELLQMGKKMLVKPLGGQMEQWSNARVIRELRLGDVMESLDPAAVQRWLAKDFQVKMDFPDVPRALADWILETDRTDATDLVHDLWSRTVRKEMLAPR
jgi:uncharacterized protein (TIGR00661 family)